MNLYIQLNPDRTVGLLSPVNLRKKVAKPKTCLLYTSDAADE